MQGYLELEQACVCQETLHGSFSTESLGELIPVNAASVVFIHTPAESAMLQKSKISGRKSGKLGREVLLVVST